MSDKKYNFLKLLHDLRNERYEVPHFTGEESLEDLERLYKITKERIDREKRKKLQEEELKMMGMLFALLFQNADLIFAFLLTQTGDLDKIEICFDQLFERVPEDQKAFVIELRDKMREVFKTIPRNKTEAKES
jgi:hypothetical protein